MSLPILGAAWPYRDVKALASLEDLQPQPDAKPLVVARPEPPEVLLAREYGGDAHFASYYVVGEEKQPRILKRALGLLEGAGAQVVSSYLVYDLDNVAHAPHATPERASEVFRELWDLRLELDHGAFIARPHFAYVGRSGYRLGFALASPVRVLDMEELLAGFRKLLEPLLPPLGIAPDSLAECADWTHLYRVPKATRDGEPLWTEPWFALRIDEGARPLLPPSKVPRTAITRAPSTPQQPYGTPSEPPPEGDCPTDDEALEAYDTLFPGNPPQPTALGAEVARRLQGRFAARHVLPHPIGPMDTLCPPEGPGRHQLLVKLAGDLAAWVAPLRPHATPVHAYALGWPHVATFDDAARPPVPSNHGTWKNHFWQLLLEFWQREQLAHPPSPPPSLLPGTAAAVAESKRTEVEEALDAQLALFGRVIEGVRQWADPEAKPRFPRGQGHLEQLWVQRRLILVVGRGQYCVMRPDGMYDPTPISADALVPRLRQLGIGGDDGLVSLESADGTKRKDAASLVHQWGYHVSQRTLVADLRSPSGVPGGILADHPLRPEMRYSTFCLRTDVEPMYDPGVDAWLRVLGSDEPDGYDFLCRWIAWALAFDEGPICALALDGASGAGKKLLARGLSECIFPVGEYATGRDFGRFGEGLARSPFLVVDEGFPSSIPLHDRADIFRQLVGGERTEVEIKNQSRFQSRVPMRIVITANAVDPITDLAGGRDLSEHDREALMIRLKHMHAPRAAKDYLESRGGIEHTRGWVAGDAGWQGNAVVARHFLALYRDRHRWPKDRRLLVEGKPDERLRRALGQASGLAALVSEGLCAMIERGGPDIEIESGDGKAYVTSQAIVEQLRTLARRVGGSPPTAKRVGEAMRHWSCGLRERQKDGLRYYRYELDLRALLEEAEHRGLVGRAKMVAILARDPQAMQMQARILSLVPPKDSLKGGK